MRAFHKNDFSLLTDSERHYINDYRCDPCCTEHLRGKVSRKQERFVIVFRAGAKDSSCCGDRHVRHHVHSCATFPINNGGYG